MTKKEQKYFKIVGEDFPFARYVQTRYNIDCTQTIPCGTQVSAKQSFYGDLCIHSEIGPVFHFCDNAFDVMLWHSLFETQNTTVYEIKPLGKVVKQRCNDSAGLYQCGAQDIEIIKPVSQKQLFKMALSEYRKKRKTKKQLYPHIDFKPILFAWIRNKIPRIY